MSNIAYLLGAGASCHSLPILDRIPVRLQEFIKFAHQIGIDEPQGTFAKFPDQPKAKLLDTFYKDLQWLLELCQRHASIDTAAKKLFLKGQKTPLIKLKSLLSIFLEYEQINKIPDPRYDAFLASILAESYNEFPENLKIISWNYDHQFELAYFDFIDSTDFNEARLLLNIISKFNSKRKPTNKFGIYKLNGTCGYMNKNVPDYEYSLYAAKNDEPRFYNTTHQTSQLESYFKCTMYPNEYHSTISFAWENEVASLGSIIETAKSANAQTNVLVIIGYSFPFFNRIIDRTILQKMESLQDIYIQSPEADNIRDRLKSILPNFNQNNIHPIKDLKQFFLPPEL